MIDEKINNITNDIINIFSRPKEPITKRFLSSIFNTEKINNYLENILVKQNEKIIKLS